MLEPFDRLAEVIKQRAEGREVIFLPNPGNFGDALIRYGAKKFLHDHRIEHFELNLTGGRMRYLLTAFLVRPRKYLYIYCGSGAFAAHYAYAYRQCRLISRFTDDLIVMPSTYGITPDGIRGTLFRRDEAQSRQNCPRSTFCHDMAFYLIARGERFAFPRVESRPVGNFFRTDRESSGRYDGVPDNRDLSLEGDHMSPIDEFLKPISACESINTDRLHVGIGAATLGKPVNLYASNYFKIHAIYESSLAGLPGVNFLGDAAFQR